MENEQDIANLIKKYSFDITNPLRRMWFKEQKSDRLVSIGHIQTINELMRVIWQAFQLHRPSLVFEPAYPTYVLDVEDAAIKLAGNSAPAIPDEIITWNLIRRTPGSIDRVAFAKSREIRPRIREELVYDPILPIEMGEPEMNEGPGQVGPDNELSRVCGYQIEGQWFDNLIQFDVWSRDNKKAEQLSEYLENFMHDFHDMFIELGVIKTHFQSRIRDEFLLKWRNGLCNRSLLYYFRTETVRKGAVREIRKIHVETEVRSFLNDVINTDVGAFVESVQNNIIHDWVSQKK